MRCNEAERRLTAYQSTGAHLRDDAELRDHLSSCRACCRLAEAAEELRRALAGMNDNVCDDVPAWIHVRHRVEAEAAANNRGYGRLRMAIDRIWKPLPGRTRWGIGVAAAALVLGFLTLVPFSYQRTVGYEVAFAGVDRNLAMDEERIQLLLSRLGVDGATVELAECQATCSLIISDVGSRDQCQMIVYAMREMGDVRVVSDGEPLCERASGPLVKLASHNVFVRDGGVDQYEIQRKVIECLGEDFPSQVSIWVSECKGDASKTACTSAAAASLAACCDSASRACSVTVELSGGVCGPGGAASQCIVICDSLSLVDHSWDDILREAGLDPALLKGDLDAEILGKLAELGFHVNVQQDGQRKIITLEMTGQSLAGPDPDAEGVQAKETAITPEGYALDQNYPNPFNPTTTIRFTIPESHRVRVEVVNMLGQKVRTLVDRTLPAGAHELQWDARSDRGERMPSGMYVYRIEAGDFVDSRTMTLLK